MENLIERGAGLDVHKATVAACLRVPGPGKSRHQEIRTFGTTTAELLALRDWLAAHGVTHVAMESTGIYWKPVFYLLEDQHTCLLVNAAHLKQVPGRKTDVTDCAWIAQLLEHGLVRGSFVPPQPLRDLRDLTRYRKSCIQDRSRVANRLHKVLEDAGLKLATVTSTVLGVSVRAMLEALLQGTTDPAVLAELARGRLRAKLPALREALAGHFRAHHAFLVGQLLGQLDALEETIAAVSAQIDAVIAPFAASRELLDSLPGVDRRTAEVLAAELGTDMTVFPSAAHCASWTGLCPGNDQSAGKRRSGRTRPGNRWVRTALIEAALAASRTNTMLGALYRRLVRSRGHKKAIVAVAHRLATLAYHVLARGMPYQDLGPEYFDARHRDRATRRALRTLEHLGYHVTLEATA
jgi:transposase